MSALVKTVKKPLLANKAAAPVVDDNKQYLTFMLGGEMFSLSILAIKEIIWYANLTDVPMMPSCIRGVINLRGAVVPVMDLSARFGKPPTPVTKSTCIVIIELAPDEEGEHQHMGVVVDSVQAVLEIPASEIEPAPSFGAKIRPDFIEGIAKVNGKFVILLNVNNVLSTEEISRMGQVAASTDLGLPQA
ncbi:MAG: chemotaxis protein CheW [Burkholderiales bacterium]|nr:chemotaxis protein CheW [Burkholderiales bacterium]